MSHPTAPLSLHHSNQNAGFPSCNVITVRQTVDSVGHRRVASSCVGATAPRLAQCVACCSSLWCLALVGLSTDLRPHPTSTMHQNLPLLRTVTRRVITAGDFLISSILIPLQGPIVGGAAERAKAVIAVIATITDTRNAVGMTGSTGMLRTRVTNIRDVTLTTAAPDLYITVTLHTVHHRRLRESTLNSMATPTPNVHHRPVRSTRGLPRSCAARTQEHSKCHSGTCFQETTPQVTLPTPISVGATKQQIHSRLL